jgi:hypothetical protein
MIHRTFEWREDKEFGGEGWIMKGQPDFNAGTGRMIAHDTLEHFAGRYDGITDEMLAFGSILYGRADGGWFNNTSNSNVAWHMSSDIGMMLRDMQYGDKEIKVAPPTRPLREDWLEETIQDAMHRAVKQANDEWGENEDPNAFSNSMKEVDRMIAWMRIGYRMARRRWHGCDAWSLSNLFVKIQEEVDLRYKHGDLGEELHVRVNPRTLEHRIYNTMAEDNYA